GFVIGLGHAWSRWCSVPGGTGLRGSSSWCSRFKASPGRPGGCVTPPAAHAAGSASRRSPTPAGTPCSVDLGVQLTAFVTLVHGFQTDRLDLGGMTGGAEGFVPGDADIAHGLDGFAEELARVELAGVLRHVATDGPGGRQTQVGIDIDLAHAVLDALDDLLD